MNYLFEKDAYCRQFKTKVLACEKGENSHYFVQLEDTVFYPEGGGQPWDTGFLNGIPVVAVRKKEGIVWHECTDSLVIGTEVSGEIDWSRRFDLMQQHSGEHIFSGIAHGLYGCENVGFHIGQEFVTVDFNCELTMEQVIEIQCRANQYIVENHAVEIEYPSEGALKTLDYRSKKELSGAVRIVRFPKADTCACCGLHVEKSGELRLLSVISCQKFRQGVRIELLCGERALGYLEKMRQENSKISQLLSAKPEDTSVSVESLLTEKRKLERRLVELETKEVERLVSEQKEKENPVLFVEGLSISAFRILAVDLAKQCRGLILCFLSDKEGFRYAVSSEEVDVRPIVKELNETFSGRGGGKANLAQGSLTATRLELEDFCEKTINKNPQPR